VQSWFHFFAVLFEISRECFNVTISLKGKLIHSEMSAYPAAATANI